MSMIIGSGGRLKVKLCTNILSPKLQRLVGTNSKFTDGKLEAGTVKISPMSLEVESSIILCNSILTASRNLVLGNFLSRFLCQIW